MQRNFPKVFKLTQLAKASLAKHHLTQNELITIAIEEIPHVEDMYLGTFTLPRSLSDADVPELGTNTTTTYIATYKGSNDLGTYLQIDVAKFNSIPIPAEMVRVFGNKHKVMSFPSPASEEPEFDPKSFRQ
jgi:hypothetical protein